MFNIHIKNIQLVFIVLLLVSAALSAQQINYVTLDDSPPRFHVQKTNQKIILDGVLDEPVWQDCMQCTDFSQYFPTDSLSANGDTRIFIAYDNEHLYIAAICYTPDDNFAVSGLKRDYGFGTNDNISFLLDTYSDKTNAYLFGMNPYGVRREALISNAGKTSESFDSSWDHKWDGNSTRHKDHWICELSIPFKTLRYKENTAQWRFNSYRNDLQNNEITSWINIPREYILTDLNYMGDLVWEEALKKPGKNISIIPFVTAGSKRDFEDASQNKASQSLSFGGDAKISVSSSLNLDLTANPDFSQIEVDQQVTNLDRFEIFFPERRQFFLENADLFGQFGSARLNPFFTRRIGISQDTTTGNNVQNTIYYGARLSGKLNSKLRIGLLNMHTAAQQQNDLPQINYSVVAAEQQVFDRSSVALLFVNKNALDTEKFGSTTDPYDRVLGLEYRLNTKNNFWTGKASLMKAFTPDTRSDKFAQMLNLVFNKRKIRLEGLYQYIGDGFDAEVGFVPRKDILILSPSLSYRFFPIGKTISEHAIKFSSRWIYKLGKDDNLYFQDFGLEETLVSSEWDVTFNNNDRLNFFASYNKLTLLESFDPTRVQGDAIFLDAGTSYSNFFMSAKIRTDSRKRFSYSVSPFVSRYYEGLRAGFSSAVTYRYQPYGSVAFEVNYNYIRLDAPFEIANLWLIGPRIDFTFSKKLFLTTFIQYNNQLDNLNINTRFQWRFAPVSDFFIVYTDNFITDPAERFGSRNRALVAKLTYWLNL